MGVIFNVEIDKDNLIFIVHFQQNRILFVGILFLLLKKKKKLLWKDNGNGSEKYLDFELLM